MTAPLDDPAWRACLAYGALFRPWIEGAPLPEPRRLRKADVAPLISLTERYGTGTSLAWRLKDDLLERDLRAFVELSLRYAREKAERRRRGILLLARAMNAIGVEPLLLKGSAAELGGIYPDPGFRLMSDIDLLVPTEQFQASAAAAEVAGFVTREDGDYGHTHAPQYHDELGLMLEIHHQVTRVYERDNFPVASLFDSATRHKMDDAIVLLPDWTMHAALVILHALAWDRTRYMAQMPFKALLDLAALKASGRVEQWNGLADLLDRAGERTSMVHVEVLFRTVFRTPLTELTVSPAEARRIVRYYAMGAAHPGLVRAGMLISQLRNRMKYVLYEPARATKLVRPSFYGRIIEEIRKALG